MSNWQWQLAANLRCGNYGLIDLYAFDAMAVHFQDGELSAFVLETVAGSRYPLELGENESGESLEAFVARKLEFVVVLEIANWHGSFENHGRRAGSRWLGRNVELVFDFTDELLEDVLDGDYSRCRSEFIDDDGKMALTRFELDQQIG
jgi:hypothetical protein